MPGPAFIDDYGRLYGERAAACVARQGKQRGNYHGEDKPTEPSTRVGSSVQWMNLLPTTRILAVMEKVKGGGDAPIAPGPSRTIDGAVIGRWQPQCAHQ